MAIAVLWCYLIFKSTITLLQLLVKTFQFDAITALMMTYGFWLSQEKVISIRNKSIHG